MADPADVLDRTDSLIQRRRTFLATRPAPPNPTPATAPAASLASPALVEDDDLPILTEVVSPEAAVSEPRIERLDETPVTLLASEIAHAVSEQLADALPALIEAALLQTSKNLRAGISGVMENALHDFLAHHRQASSPEPAQENENAVVKPPPQ